MCGRYALSIRAAFVRHQLQQQGIPVDDAPDDEETRSTYNFAPGYYGLVYRADTPPSGAGYHREAGEEVPSVDSEQSSEVERPKYKLQSMKWGLVPFWTKRNPDYGSLMKTINCRDDSLIEDRGMWTSMKKSKRCIVVAEGFYEWLKKNDGKEKLPHFTRRKDGQLMLFAGLWDCVTYDDSPDEQHWTYTIITTDVNKQLSFLHDRMPVILDPSEISTWLNPIETEWTSELQALLKPYRGELDCYQVSKEVGKVGNNSQNFIVPIASPANKNNIANFFGNAKQKNTMSTQADAAATGLEKKADYRPPAENPASENKAPKPMPMFFPQEGEKRGPSDEIEGQPPQKASRPNSPTKTPKKPAQKFRSATSNNTMPAKSPAKAKDGSQKITSFFSR